MSLKNFTKNISQSFFAKMLLLISLLMILFLGIQTFVYIQLESKTLENSLIENKKEFTELLATNLGAAQEVGGFAFQSELIKQAGEAKDTIYVRFVRPNGEIYLSNILEEQGRFIEGSAITANKSIIRDENYNGEKIKVVISPGVDGYSVYLGFSLQSIQEDIGTLVISRVIFFIVVLIIGVAVSYFLFKRATKTIRLLKNITKEVGQGNLNVRANIHSEDEFGQLATAFNHMIYDLKKSRAEIEEYNINLEKLLKQKDNFINQLSHDLKSPLTPLVGLLPILKDSVTDEHSKAIADSCIKSTNHMKNLVFKTLQLAKLNAPNFKLNRENLHLLSEVNDAIGNNQFLFDENKVKVENKVDKEIFIQADKLQLKEIFDNLFSNAVKYSFDNDNKKIIIDARTDGNKDMIISVNDNGMGMTDEQQKYVFDEFYKTDPSRHDLDSSGLGLTICKRIIEQHGGKIWVKSPGLGRGSTVFFSFPSVVSKIQTDICGEKLING
jgi:signal transduction histidine kinase